MEKSELWKVHIAQLIVQLCGALYYVLTKSSLSGGVNKIVFSVYQKGSALIILALAAAFSDSRGERPRLTAYAVLLMFFAGLTGIYFGQILLLAGLSLTGSAFAAAMQNAMPVFAFVIAAVFRLEHVRLDRRDGVAKVVGVVCCVAGAFVMSMYQGPVVFGDVSMGEPQPVPDAKGGVGDTVHQFLESTFLHWGMSSWQLGSLCLVGSTLCISIFINLQAATVALYPAPVHMVGFVTLFGVVMLAVTGLWTASPAEWAVTRTSDIIAILYGGGVTSAFCSSLSSWCLQKSGPVLVAAYMPLLAVFSAVLGLVALGDVLYLGSILGALLIFAGLFLVTWGKEEHRRLEAEQALEAFPTLKTHHIPVEAGVQEPLLMR